MNWVLKGNPRETEVLSKLAKPRGNAKKSQIHMTCISEIDPLNTTLHYSALIKDQTKKRKSLRVPQNHSENTLTPQRKRLNPSFYLAF